MKKIKSICAMLLVFLCVAWAVIPCCAETQTGKITVLLEDKNKEKIDGAIVHICKIADMDKNGYQPSQSFKNSGISISGIINSPSESYAKDIAAYIADKNIGTIAETAENGKAVFEELDLGIWLVFGDETSKYTFNPYIVFLPFEADGKLYYEVSSAPKVEDNIPDEINIYVIKKWDDQSNAAKKRPESVTVELLDGDTVISTVELNEQNGWAHTFSGKPKSGEYSVKERAVEGYTVQYSGDVSNGFVVTNIYNGEKLPQTGQLWWPIGIIAVAGVSFILLGIIELGARKNGKKNK